MNTWSGFGGLNLSGIDAESGRKTLTPGSHICRIAKAEVKDSKDGSMKGLMMEYEALDGSGSVSEWITIWARSPDKEKSVEIGLRRLKAMLIAAKHENPDRPTDVKTMLNLRIGVNVEEGEEWVDDKGEKRKGGGKPRKSGAYFPVDARPSGLPVPPAAGSALPNDAIPF